MQHAGLAPKLDPSGMVEAVLTEIGEEAGMNKAESETSMEESTCAYKMNQKINELIH